MSTDKHNTKFLVVGGGPGGALMAAYLGQAGYTVEVYERRPDLRSAEVPAGRSINLALSYRGICALEGIGIAEKVLASAVPMHGRMLHAQSGRLTFQRYGRDDSQSINSVSRAHLTAMLLDAAQRHPTVQLAFNEKCIGVDLDAATIDLEHAETGQRRTVHGDVIIGADGAFSAVRNQMQHLDRFDYRQDYLEHGYKELTIPPGANGGFAMEKHALHIWPRRSFMMIGLPNQDGSYTCTLFWPLNGPNSFSTLQTEDDVRRFFEATFPDAVPLIPTLANDYLRNPTSSLHTVRCSPWYYLDRVALLGDACHAVVPFYGQGMNAAFEDCIVLDECIRRHAPDWERAFQEYHTSRKADVDALADLALQNFVEMRDHAASPVFQVKKRAGQWLHRMMPNWFVPLYSMATFTRIPYTQAVRRARRQDRILTVVGIGLVVLLLLLLWMWIGGEGD